MCWLNFNREHKSSCHNFDLQNFTQETVTLRDLEDIIGKFWYLANAGCGI